ncbi:MAG: hypothetical protein V7K41_30275 [Nostoc sp.]
MAPQPTPTPVLVFSFNQAYWQLSKNSGVRIENLELKCITALAYHTMLPNRADS